MMHSSTFIFLVLTIFVSSWKKILAVSFRGLIEVNRTEIHSLDTAMQSLSCSTSFGSDCSVTEGDFRLVCSTSYYEPWSQWVTGCSTFDYGRQYSYINTVNPDQTEVLTTTRTECDPWCSKNQYTCSFQRSQTQQTLSCVATRQPIGTCTQASGGDACLTTSSPSVQATSKPTTFPSSKQPTKLPTRRPTTFPTITQPSTQTAAPTRRPTSSPTVKQTPTETTALTKRSSTCSRPCEKFPAGSMSLGENGLNTIIHFEGFSPTCYNDQHRECVDRKDCKDGVWTIGYGHACLTKPEAANSDDLPQYNVICNKNACSGKLTKQQARQVLALDAADAVQCVRTHVKVPVTQNQFDALVSYVLNRGCPKFQKSEILTGLNSGKLNDKKLFNLFTIVCNDCKSENYGGLSRRRYIEAKLFLSCDINLNALLQTSNKDYKACVGGCQYCEKCSSSCKGRGSTLTTDCVYPQ